MKSPLIAIRKTAWPCGAAKTAPPNATNGPNPALSAVSSGLS